jgi:hypothetical protein
MYNYQKLFDYACDKLYVIETKCFNTYKGLLLNYSYGNVVLLTEKGIVHLTKGDIYMMHPTKRVSEEFQKVLDDAKIKLKENDSYGK